MSGISGGSAPLGTCLKACLISSDGGASLRELHRRTRKRARRLSADGSVPLQAEEKEDEAKETGEGEDEEAGIEAEAKVEADE